MRKLACIILSLSLIFGLVVTANTQNIPGKTNLEALTALSLVKGTDKGFIPDKSPTRGEAAVLTVKLMGQEGFGNPFCFLCVQGFSRQ